MARAATRWFPDGRIGRVSRTGKMVEIETKKARGTVREIQTDWKTYDNVAAWDFLGRFARGDKNGDDRLVGTCVGKCPPRRGLLPTFLMQRWCRPRPSPLSLAALPYGTFLAEGRGGTALTGEAAPYPCGGGARQACLPRSDLPSLDRGAGAGSPSKRTRPPGSPRPVLAERELARRGIQTHHRADHFL